MTTDLHPWAPAELAPTAKALSLTDQIAIVFELLWADDVDNSRNLATSTDNGDAVEGTVTIDKILLAAGVKRLAQHLVADGRRDLHELANVHVSQITRRMHHAQKRFGVDRVAIAARKAEFLALVATEPVDEAEPINNVDGRREVDGA